MGLHEVDPGRRAAVVIGIVLVGLGLLALVGRAFEVDVFDVGWPLFVIVPGAVMFVGALAIGGRPGLGLAIPGGVVAMVGLVLAVQAATGLWATWAYAWAIVAPGGVGVGMVAYGLLTGQADLARPGVPVLLTGLGLFFCFGLFFEGVLGLSGPAIIGLENALAAGILGVGVLVLLVGLMGGRRSV